MSTFVRKCPTCGKVFKYTDSIKLFCDVCKSHKTLEDIPTTDDVRETMLSYTKFCPKCGKYYDYEDSKKFTCDRCHVDLIESDFTNEQAWHMTGQQVCEWRKNHIETNPLFDKDANERMKQEFIMPNLMQQSFSAPHCPRCGSTSFQMVQRKWGVLTGFFTNKVDRVCTQCKTRF